MAFEIALEHQTEYRYQRAVALGPQRVQLHPAPHCRTPVRDYRLTVTPAEHTVRWSFDALGNHVAQVVVPGPTAAFAVLVKLVADLQVRNPFDFVVDPAYAQFPFAYSPELAADLAPYLSPAEPTPRLRAFTESLPRQAQPVVSFLVDLNQRLRAEIGYNLRMEHGVQSPEETLRLRSGSCRDSAWLMIEVCRQVGLAARFVSGYLVQLAEDAVPRTEPAGERAEEQPGERLGPAQDSADLHAWTEVYLPGAGWIGFDSTSGLLAAEGHLPLACAPTPGQTAPVIGTVEPAGVEFAHSLRVRRLPAAGGATEEPALPRTEGAVQNCSAPQSGFWQGEEDADRLAAPYDPETWARVRAVAHRVDRELEAGDAQLTVGGEPTFVAEDDPDSLQWNFEALGPAKRERGLELIGALRERTAPGGLLHRGQGKWYPNEVLPRWSFLCLSRVDGVAIWEDPALFAQHTAEYGFGDGEARRFAEALTRRLGAETENLLPAFNPERAEGEAAPVGYILPLRRRQPDGVLRWSSQPWFPKPEHVVLSPGDSPIGYRIPVAAMPFVAPDSLEYEKNEAGEVSLPTRPARRPEMFATEAKPDSLPPAPEHPELAPVLIRPALCVEVRDGRLHVFLPFVPVLADYLDLVAAVEETSAHLGLPVWVEGYPPNFDPRIRTFGLTPDPGVLEVNLPPARSWDEMEAVNEVLAEEAHRLGLIEGKFGYEGNHTATGGGSHIVLGGPTVADSPLLRRPELLRSLLTFWQQHPSLSYLFAGMYVGPTSQYPRIDEARTDALYETELSFSQLPAGGCGPETLDGLFRNLLVDVTGNTHRAEFCIDKLFPPEGAGLRAGLLELRAFEMAPHPRMGLLQMLLVRALVAAFWTRPHTGKLVRWGAALHDRFMLPHFLLEDFGEVLRSLREAGFAFEERWFGPHAAFRFPVIGTLRAGEVAVELRQALEPWNVLAEETTASGTGRSVDSSLERMQVKANGWPVEGRYVLACNGRRVPLTPTGAPGEAVAGVRYRARRLHATLHPTIPVHLPLRFALIDTETAQVVARCAYFAGRPNGQLYERRPNNAAEARARRAERFVVEHPTVEPGMAVGAVPKPEENKSYPMTLDLRQPAMEPAVAELAAADRNEGGREGASR